jgi:hypothetical protein
VKYELHYPYRPWLINAERKMHWATRSGLIQLWMTDFMTLTRQAKIPPLKSAMFTVVSVHSRLPLPDTGATFPSFKAAQDGVVRAGVLPDDTAQFVTAVTFLPPLKGDDGFTLIIEGEPA